MIKLINRLGQVRILPVTFSVSRIPLEVQVPTQSLYGLDGAVKTGKSTIPPRQLILQGTVITDNKQDTRQEVDSLLPFLMAAPLHLYRHHEDTRFLQVYPTGAPQEWLTWDTEVNLRVPLLALDPYWYGAKVEESLPAGTTTLEVEGTALAHPVITTIGSVETLTVKSLTNGYEIKIVGAGGAVEVDTLDYTVTVGAQSAIDLANDEWLLYGFELLPGTNQIQTNTPITMTYRPRWW